MSSLNMYRTEAEIRSLIVSDPILRATLVPCHTISVIKESKKQGTQCVVAHVTTRDAAYILKIYPSYGRYVSKHCAAHDLLRDRLPVDVPELVSYRIEPLPAFVLLRFVEGPSLAQDPGAVRDVLPQVLSAIAVLREIVGTEYGELTGEFAPIPNDTVLRSYLERSVEYWLSGLRRTAGNDSVARLEVLARKVGICDSLLSHLPTICHSDLTPENLIVSERKVTIIDFDNAFWLIPEFDLCKFFLAILGERFGLSLSVLVGETAAAFRVRAQDVVELISRFFWIVGLRVLHWLASRALWPQYHETEAIILRVYAETEF